MILYPRRFVRATAGRHRHKLAMDGGDRFNDFIDPSAIAVRQLNLFNATWNTALDTPFYEYWAKRHSLPNRISDLSELDRWPVLTKDNLRERADLVDATQGIIGHFTTSGSSSEPFSFPRGEGEFAALYRDSWSYRAANGLQPFDSFLVLTNIAYSASVSRTAQAKARLTRQIKDLAGNSWNANGFIADDVAADNAIKLIQLHRPKYLVGYTSALAVVGRRAIQRGLKFPYITTVIPSCETVDSTDVDIMEKAFSADVVVEYGATELGVIAGTGPSQRAWPVKVLWWSNLIRLGENSEAVCTSLTNRIFPLINYSVGDVVTPGIVGPGGTVLELESIEGRTKDTLPITLRDGSMRTLRARQLVYLVRELDGIESVQIAPRPRGRADIVIAAPTANTDDIVRRAAASVRRNQPDIGLDTLRLRFVDRHIPGARGKRGVIIQPEQVPNNALTFNI